MKPGESSLGSLSSVLLFLSGGTASAASLTLTTKATGAGQNGPISLSMVATQVRAAPASLSGGGGSTYDTGTVTANINGTVVTTGYGQSSTTQTVAAALAAAISGAGAGVTATAAAGTITVSASQAGVAGNGVTVTLSSVSDEPQFFTSSSFSGTSGTLSGGEAGASAGPIYTYNVPVAGYDVVGNIKPYADCVPTTPGSPCVGSAWSMSYDNLNRVSTATSSAGPWIGLSLGCTYDPYGNRTSQTTTGTPPSPAPPTKNWSYPSKNQATTLTYDPSGVGFVTYDGANNYAYDAEGRLCAIYNPTLLEYTEYIYDAEGRRVAKGRTNSLNCNPTAGYAQTESYILSQSGQHITELDGSGNFLRSHVYANGQLLATYVNNSTQFAFNDWLGTKRVLANPDGTVTGACINLPFGDELICDGNVPLDGHHYTGKERDTESGLDYFVARYYGSSMGRFMSPDPSRLSINPKNPQTWNRYSYVYNNPLGLKDDNGKWPTEIHNQIIDKAFPNLSASQRQILKNVSADQDSILSGGQGNSLAFQHAMRGPDQTVDQAQGQYNDFVSGEEGAAQNAQLQFWMADPDNKLDNLSDASLEAFGAALHAVLDSTSPAHAGFQVWNVWNLAADWRHHNAEKTISPAQMQRAVSAAQNAYNATYGNLIGNMDNTSVTTTQEDGVPCGGSTGNPCK